MCVCVCVCVYVVVCFFFMAARHVVSELPDQGSNPQSLHWKVKQSQPLEGQASPYN